MKVIDLTQVIESNMPVYPGTEPPVFEPASTYEKDGFKETMISMFSRKIQKAESTDRFEKAESTGRFE